LALIVIFFGLNLASDNEYIHILSSIAFAGAVTGFSFANEKSYQFLIIVSSLTLAVTFTSNFYFLNHYEETDVLKRSTDRFITLVNESPEFSKNEKKEILQTLDGSMDTIRDLIPFTYFLNSLLLSVCCFFFLKTVFMRRFFELIQKIQGIEFFKIQEYFIFLLIAGWLTVLLIDSEKYHEIYLIGLNMGLVFLIFYLIQSFGIIKFILLKKGLPTLILPLSIFITIVIGVEYFFFLLILLSSLGILDFWSDFRKLNPQEEKSEDKSE